MVASPLNDRTRAKKGYYFTPISLRVLICSQLRRRRQRFRPFSHEEPLVLAPLERRGVESQKLAAPPHSRRVLGGKVREPVLPQHGANLLRWSLRKRIAGEQRKHLRITREQQLLGAKHKGIFAPVAERGEPQVPVKARLVWRVNAWRLGGTLRLVAEAVSDPVLAVVRSLEFDLETLPGHAAKQTVLVRDTKWLDECDRFRWQREGTKGPGQKKKNVGIKDPGEEQTSHPKTRGLRKLTSTSGHRDGSGFRNGFVGVSSLWICRGGLRCFRGRKASATRGRRRNVLEIFANLDGPARWQELHEKPVIEEKEAERKNDVIQKGVVGGQDDANLKKGHDKEAHDAETPRQEEHPYNDQFDTHSHRSCCRVEPVRQLLRVPADPGRQRAVLIILIHRREVSPGWIASEIFRDTRLEVNGEPEQPQEEKARARRRI